MLFKDSHPFGRLMRPGAVASFDKCIKEALSAVLIDSNAPQIPLVNLVMEYLPIWCSQCGKTRVDVDFVINCQEEDRESTVIFERMNCRVCQY